MKKLQRVGLTAMIAITTLLFNGCAKDGATGPQGPQGATGPQGPSAKMKEVTAIFNSTTPWVSFAVYDIGFNGDAGDICLVYFKDPSFPNDKWYIATPYTWYDGTSSPVAYFWHEEASVSSFIYAQKPGSSATTSAFSSNTTHNFKIVAIKASAIKKLQNVDINDISQVQKALNL